MNHRDVLAFNQPINQWIIVMCLHSINQSIDESFWCACVQSTNQSNGWLDVLAFNQPINRMGWLDVPVRSLSSKFWSVLNFYFMFHFVWGGKGGCGRGWGDIAFSWHGQTRIPAACHALLRLHGVKTNSFVKCKCLASRLDETHRIAKNRRDGPVRNGLSINTIAALKTCT